MNLRHPAWRHQPLAMTMRVAKSLVRRTVPGLRCPPIAYDGGRSRIYADLATALGLTLYRYGAPHGPDLALVRLLLRPGDLFVDGGANVGLFTLVAAASVGPTGAVIAFEPVEKTRAALDANVRLNGFGWVEVRPEALDSRGGERDIVAFAESAAGLSSFRPESTAGGHIETVRTTTLDDAVGARRGAVRLVKLDLEGAEYDALLGGRKLLAETGPDLILEFEPKHLARAGASVDALIALLRDHGYRLYSVDMDGSSCILKERFDFSTATPDPNVYVTRDASRALGAGARVHGDRGA